MIEKEQILDVAANLSKTGTNSIGDKNFQIKLAKLIIADEKGFSEQIIDIIKPEYFDNTHIKILFQYLLEYTNEYNTIPDFDILKNIIKENESNEHERDYLIQTLEGIEKSSTTDNNYIQKTSLDFCKKQSLKNGILKAADVWSKGDYDSIATVIQEALRVGEPKNSGHDYTGEVEKRLAGENNRYTIPALSGLDIKIGGGLAGGELGVVLSPTGGGKSMMLVKFCVEAFKQKKNVLYYSFELKERIIGTRIDSCLFNLPLSHVPEYANVIKRGIEDYEKEGAKIFIKEYPSGSATINTIRNHVKTLERDHKFKPDVIFVDYADIMKATTSFSENRHNLTSIYVGLRGLAGELDVPIWTASQATRDAINSDKFDLKSISESLGKAQTADVVIGLARNDDQKRVKAASLLLLKNRFGEDGIKMPLHFDTAYINISATNQSSNNKVKKMMQDTEENILNGNVGFGGLQ